jgi:hypothetical protein
MGLRERFDPRNNRGNVMLAAAMMLAVLVVLVALGLALAPTGSDGITDESADTTEFDVLEQGLQAVVFVESNDTLDPDYDPEFHPPETDRPAPIDTDTVAELLSAQPFTDEQVVQIQSQLTSLAYRSLGGDIAALEPVASDTETGVLARLGNLDPYEFGPDNTTILENATAVRDVELVFERTTLPASPENATTAHIGNWTAAAYQNRSTDRVHYQLGSYDPDADWYTTAPEANLHVNVHENTVNGKSIDDGVPPVDPGGSSVDVWVSDDDRGETAVDGTYGGLNLVAVGADGDDINQNALDNGTDWQTVVTRPVLNATYLDATTSLSTRLAFDTEYTYFEYAHNGSEPFLVDVSLAVETENESQLADGPGASEEASGPGVTSTGTGDTIDRLDADGPTVPEGNIWLPDYTLETPTYNISVVATYSDGNQTVLTSDAEFSIEYYHDDQWKTCELELGPGECASLNYHGPYVEATPTLLTGTSIISKSVQIEANVTVPDQGQRTLTENVTVRDPYIDVGFNTTSAVPVGGTTPGLDMTLDPRLNGLDERQVTADSVPKTVPVQVATHLFNKFGLNKTDRSAIAKGLMGLSDLNSSQQEAFLNADSAAQRAEMVAPDGASLSLLSPLTTFFDKFEKGVSFNLMEETIKTQSDDRTERAAAFGQLSQGLPDAPAEATPERLEQLATIASRVETRINSPRPVDDEFLWTVHNAYENIEFPNQPGKVSTAFAKLFDENADYSKEVIRNFESIMEDYVATLDNETAGLFDESVPVNTRAAAFGQAASNNTNIDHIGSGDMESWYTTVNEFDGGDFSPTNFPLSGGKLRGFFLLGNAHTGGVIDVPLDTLVNVTQALDTTWDVETSISQSLFEMTKLDILDTTAFENGNVALGDDRDRLLADWDVAVRGAYEGYDFATYQATDVLTVSDPTDVVDVSLEINYSESVKELVNGTLPNDHLYTTHPIIVNDTTQLHSEVEYLDGDIKTNPDIVSYEVINPSFSGTANYTGPDTPADFATTTDSEHTITAHAPTGQWLSSGANASDTDTGPIVVKASVPGSGVADTATTSAATVSAEGALGWSNDPDTTVRIFDTSGGSAGTGVAVGIEYAFQHGAPGFTYPGTYESVGSTGFDRLALNRTADVEFDRPEMEFSVDGGVAFDTVPATAVDIEETAALDIDYVTQELFNATAYYGATDGAGSGPGDDPNSASFLGGLTVGGDKSGGTVIDTRYDESGLTSAPAPHHNRGDQVKNALVPHTNTVIFNGYANADAYSIYGANASLLANGSVEWRSSNCGDRYQCEAKPIALIDLAENSQGWNADLSSKHNWTLNNKNSAPKPTWNYSVFNTGDTNVTEHVILDSVDNNPKVSLTVQSKGDDNDGGGGGVEAGMTIDNIIPPDGPLIKGASYTVSVEVENTGDMGAVATPTYSSAGGTDTAAGAILYPGDSKKFTFTGLEVPPSDVSSITHVITTSDDKATATTSVAG